MTKARHKEKRKYSRSRAKDLTFVKLLSESGEEDIGQLLDISQGGISLRYFTDDQELRKYSELDIVLSGVSFSIDNIPFEIVSDIKMTNGSFSRLSGLRRYSIKFDKLTSDHQSKLKYFLQNHTVLNDS